MYSRFPGIAWVTPYGVMLTLACVVAWACARRRAVATGLDPSHVDLALPLAFVGGALCARLLAWVMPQELALAGNALAAEERLRLYAVAFVGLPLLYAYSHVAGVSFRRLADVAAVPALLWLAILRVGCFLAGCCFGDLSDDSDRLALVADPRVRLQLQTLPALARDDLPLAVQFPAGSFAWQQQQALGLLGPDATASLPVHPVQLYETAIVLLVAAALVHWRRGLRLPGSEALAALGGYAASAFLLEFLRADNALLLGPLTGNQLICASWLAATPMLAAWLRLRAVATPGAGGR